MSKRPFNVLNEIDDLIQKHGKDGVRLLFLFKTLKTYVEESIEKNHSTVRIEEETLNRLCIQKAQELVKLKKESPTERDFKELLSKAIRKPID